MKVYAVVKRCDDDHYPDYTIVDDRVFLKKEDADKKMKEMDTMQRFWPEYYEIYDFEVKQNDRRLHD